MDLSVLHTCAFVIVNFLLISINFLMAKILLKSLLIEVQNLSTWKYHIRICCCHWNGCRLHWIRCQKIIRWFLNVMHDSTVNRTTNFSGDWIRLPMHNWKTWMGSYLATTSQVKKFQPYMKCYILQEAKRKFASN